MLTRVAFKAGSQKVLKAIVTAFGNGLNVVQGGREPSQLFSTIATLVFISFEDFDAVLLNA